MGEGHAYGLSLGCVSRRLFVLTTSSVMLALCLIQLARWALSFKLWDAVMGNTVKVEAPAGCIGSQCYEVLSCFGMKDASLHVREPLVTLAGVVMLPTAISGAHHCSHRDLRLAAVFFIATAVLHVGVVLADAAYVHVCGSYSTNMVYQTLLNWMPPSPLHGAAQAKLQSMALYPVEDVAEFTNNFEVLKWYFAVAGSLALFLVYVAREVLLLGDLAERGPLGLGMHFGLNQWDEVLNHDAIRRHKLRSKRSAFLDDAQLPITGNDVESARLAGYATDGCGYGAMAHLPRVEDGPGGGDDDDGDGDDEDEAQRRHWLREIHRLEAEGAARRSPEAPRGPSQPPSGEALVDSEDDEEAVAAALAAAAAAEAEEAQAAAEAAAAAAAERRGAVY